MIKVKEATRDLNGIGSDEVEYEAENLHGINVTDPRESPFVNMLNSVGDGAIHIVDGRIVSMTINFRDN